MPDLVRNFHLHPSNRYKLPCYSFTPDLIKGDLDSLRVDVQLYYSSRGVRIIQDGDQDSTDLMKCIGALVEDEKAERHVEVGVTPSPPRHTTSQVLTKAYSNTQLYYSVA